MVREAAENLAVVRLDGEEVNPGVVHEVGDFGMAAEGEAEVLARGFDEDAEAEGIVDPFFTVVQGLKGKAGAEVAAIAEANAEGADDVVEDFVAAAEEVVVHGGTVVLEVDPTGDDHGGCEDQLESGVGGVALVVIVVEEDAATEVEVAGALPWGGDEGGIACQAPLGTDLRPVSRALSDAAVEGEAKVGADAERGGALAAGFFGGAVQPELEAVEVLVVGCGQGVVVEESDLVGGGVVEAGDEVGVGGDDDAQGAEAFTDVGEVEEGGGDAGVGLA